MYIPLSFMKCKYKLKIGFESSVSFTVGYINLLYIKYQKHEIKYVLFF